MQPKEMFDVLAAQFGPEVIFDFHADPKKDKDPWFQVKPYEIEAVAEFLKTDARFSIDTLECLTGVDYLEQNHIAVIYHFYSYSLRHRLVVKTFLPREDPSIPTLVNVWSVANWQERECYDLVGVLFEGHPDLRRLLLPDDWEGYPLRKDYAEKDEYHGIPTTRPNPLELFQISKAPAKA
jgi:NADH-quinone oxidoreductase subunit C